MASTIARDALVSRLEAFARRSPRAYRVRLLLLAALGFGVLGGSVLLALGMSAGLVLALFAISPVLLLKLAKVVWIPVAFGWVVLRALWVRFEPPAGRLLAAGEAPALVAEVERLRRAAGAPRLSGIVLDDDLNAAAVSVPRLLGLLGHRHYLVLGLPLMQALDRDEFASVVAHEFGHFGGGHGSFSGWIYRVRGSWYRLLHALSARDAWSARLFQRFFGWYAPYFDAYSFVLARENEYAADAVAARVAGAGAAATALVRVNVGAHRLHEVFWPGVVDANRRQPEPPETLMRDMARALRTADRADPERLAGRLAAAPDPYDTHPTLAQRLQAFGVEVAVSPADGPSAAEALLGDELTAFEEAFSRRWRDGVAERWREDHAAHVADSERLGELEMQETRSPADAVEHAALVERLHPGIDALPLYRRAVALAPEDAFAWYRLGELLLARDDRDGIDALRRALALDPGAARTILNRLGAFHDLHAEADALAAVERELDALDRRERADQRARQALSFRDPLEPHGLDAAALARVRASLAATGKVGRAWIVRRPLAEAAHAVPHFLVLVRWRGLLVSESSALQAVVDALDLPGSFVAFTAPHQRLLAWRLKRRAGVPTWRSGMQPDA